MCSLCCHGSQAHGTLIRVFCGFLKLCREALHRLPLNIREGSNQFNLGPLQRVSRLIDIKELRGFVSTETVSAASIWSGKE